MSPLALWKMEVLQILNAIPILHSFEKSESPTNWNSKCFKWFDFRVMLLEPNHLNFPSKKDDSDKTLWNWHKIH